MIELRDILGHFLVDFGFCGAAEAFSFPLRVLIHIPDNTAPAVVCALERPAVRQQFSLCHNLHLLFFVYSVAIFDMSQTQQLPQKKRNIQSNLHDIISLEQIWFCGILNHKIRIV